MSAYLTEEVLQVIFVPRSRLNRYIDQSQLPQELDGTFMYDDEQWTENRLVRDERNRFFFLILKLKLFFFCLILKVINS